MLDKVWRLPRVSVTCEMPLAKPPFSGLDSDTHCFFRISPANDFASALDLTGDTHKPIVRKKANVTGMMWRVTLAEEEGRLDCYRFSTRFLGNDICLDIADTGAEPLMRPRADIPSQYWRIVCLGDDGYKFVTVLHEKQLSLVCPQGHKPRDLQILPADDNGAF